MMLLVGCGNIGKALLKLWASSDIFGRRCADGHSSIVVVQPSLAAVDDFSRHRFIKFVADLRDIPADFVPEIIVLAIKPQIANSVVSNLVIPEKAVLISMLAGTRLAKLSEISRHGHRKIVRIMPTVAIRTGQSVNLMFADKNDVNDDDMSVVRSVIEPSGKIIPLKSESHLDLLTPISGSGPAYFFLLSEILQEEAVKLGVDEDTARDIIQGVLVGSAGLAESEAVPSDFASLRKSVTSKGGVTEAALKIMSPEMRDVLQRSLQSAQERLKEL
jgi:pyrroline-5-carboxylate reductase